MKLIKEIKIESNKNEAGFRIPLGSVMDDIQAVAHKSRFQQSFTIKIYNEVSPDAFTPYDLNKYSEMFKDEITNIIIEFSKSYNCNVVKEPVIDTLIVGKNPDPVPMKIKQDHIYIPCEIEISIEGSDFNTYSECISALHSASGINIKTAGTLELVKTEKRWNKYSAYERGYWDGISFSYIPDIPKDLMFYYSVGYKDGRADYEEKTPDEIDALIPPNKVIDINEALRVNESTNLDV